MRLSIAVFITLSILALFCSHARGGQEGFVERAEVLVTGDPLHVGNEPWITPPDSRLPGVHGRGWNLMKASTTVALRHMTKVEFYIFLYGDHRGRTTGKPEVRVTGNRIIINIPERYDGKPKTPVYIPSLWSERAIVMNLKRGNYEVNLHNRTVGELSIF